VKKDNKKTVTKMFNSGKSPYQIHNETGINLKEVYHFVRLDGEAQARYNKQLKANRDAKIIA